MVGFRLELAVPATTKKSAFTKTFEAGDHSLSEVTVELHKEKRAIGNLVAVIHCDNVWRLLDQMPDIAFDNIPCVLYMSKPGSPEKVTHKVFDGKVTAYDPRYPENILTITAHDKSIDARKSKTYQTFKKLTSVQIAERVAKIYGYDVDQAGVTAELKQRNISTGHGDDSDWDHMARELAMDGLEFYVKGNKLKIRNIAKKRYPVVFGRLDPVIRDFQAKIAHVRGPGSSGNIKNTAALATGGDAKALDGARAQAVDKQQGGEHRTHRRPTGTTSDGAHLGDASKWTAYAGLKYRRQDEATMVIDPTPDITLDHYASLDDFGEKIDGDWEIRSIRHALLSGGGSATTLNIQRPKPRGTLSQSKNTAALASQSDASALK